MAAKIRAARATRTHLRIIARTDALASEGLDGAIARARLYIDAGSDVIFPEVLTSPEEMLTFNNVIDATTLAIMTEFGRTPYLSRQEVANLGFNIVIWPVTPLRCGAAATRDHYAHFAKYEGQCEYLDNLINRKDICEANSYNDYEALDSSIAQSVVPDDGTE